MTDAEYKRKILERAKELVDGEAARSPPPPTRWREVDLDEISNEVAREPSLFEDILRQTGGMDWHEVANDLSDAMRARIAESGEIAEVMDGLGFEGVYTGGGCDAYQLDLEEGDDPPHIMVTDEANVPETWDADVTVGRYKFYGDDGEYEFYTMREFVDAVRAGRSRLVPQSQAAGHAAAGHAVAHAIAPQDLEAINRHRRGLGMAPIDLGAGWTEEELKKMADTVRREGRMFNPQQLKRRLLR